jgi:alpha-D-ribose 1-methylphosphonate 5-triphosphate synthase subunit PhnH
MSIDLPGFAAPVTDAQACFRALLDAMARPGRVHDVAAGLTAPAPLVPATAAVLLTLVDAETPLWLAPEFAPTRDWIDFHCGAPVVTDIGAASFVVCDSLPDLATLDAGTDESPDASATVILQVHGLTGGRGLRLDGPGLREPADLAVDGLPDDFVARWAANHALFPRGIDLILAAGHEVAAMPRSLRILRIAEGM